MIARKIFIFLVLNLSKMGDFQGQVMYF